MFVLMQYARTEKLVDGFLLGKFSPLPNPSVDTGMGLERVSAVLQGKISDYDTDLFTPLTKKASELTGAYLVQQTGRQAASLRIIADHARATTFLVADGVLPSNEGRGYVLRKIMRRAIRHVRLLGNTSPVFPVIVPEVLRLMAQPPQP